MEIRLLFLCVIPIIISFLTIIYSLKKSFNKTLNEALEELKTIKEKGNIKRPNSYEVHELLHDLTAGKALIEIRRVDPSSFFIRSPRDE